MLFYLKATIRAHNTFVLFYIQYLNTYLYYFIFLKFFRKLFFYFFIRLYSLNKQFLFFKPIFKLNFFKNFIYSNLKPLPYVKYKFFLKIKKTLFFYRRFQNFKKDMFYYIFRSKTKLKLTFVNFWNSQYYKHKYSARKLWFSRPKQLNLRYKYKVMLFKNRELINYFLYFKKIKQHRNTKYFSQFKFKNPFQIFQTFNYNVISMLYFSNLFYSHYQILFFIKNKFIYKNGQVVHSCFTTFKLGDRLNIIFSKKYYFYSIFLYFFFFKQLKKLNKYHWKFIRFKFNFYKQKPKSMNKFFEKYLPFYTTQPTCFEFDYRSLTVLFIIQNTKLVFLNDFYLRYINYYFFRLYNWKYVV